MRAAGGIDSSGTVAQSQELSSARAVSSPELGLFLQKEDTEVALGYSDFLEGLRTSRPYPLKERRQRLKIEVFKVSIANAPCEKVNLNNTSSSS